MARTLWVQSIHEITPTAAVQVLDLLSGAVNDRPLLERATIVNVRGVMIVKALRTDASSGSLEFFHGLTVMHTNMDLADVISMNQASISTMGWMWRTHFDSYLYGDGTLPIFATHYQEPIDVRSKRTLGRGGTLWSVFEGVNVGFTVATVRLAVSTLLSVP